MEDIIDIISEYGVFVLRVILPFLVIFVILKCYSSMKSHQREKRALITLYNTNTDENIPVYYWENSIGRSKGSDIYIPDSTASRDHAVLLRRNEGWFITDTNSKAGVYVNEKRCSGRTQIFLEDTIRLGTTSFTVKTGDESAINDEHSAFYRKKAIRPFPLLILMLFTLLICFTETAFSIDGFLSDSFMLYGIYSAIVFVFYTISRGILRRSSFEIETLGCFLTGMGLSLLVRQNMRQAYVQMISAVIGIVLFMVIIKMLESPDSLMKLRILQH